MNLHFETKVDGNYLDVMQRFDKALFEALAPKGAKLEILEFTGSKKGDKVHLRFLSPIKAEWISEITDHGSNDELAYFIDRGIKIPFGIVFWEHHHIVKKETETTSIIVDDIKYKGVNKLWTLLMYPGLFISFLQRKPIYKSFFKQ